jgi:hypothetical protein
MGKVHLHYELGYVIDYVAKLAEYKSCTSISKFLAGV